MGLSAGRAEKWDGCQGTGPVAAYVLLTGEGPVGKNTGMLRRWRKLVLPQPSWWMLTGPKNGLSRNKHIKLHNLSKSLHVSRVICANKQYQRKVKELRLKSWVAANTRQKLLLCLQCLHPAALDTIFPKSHRIHLQHTTYLAASLFPCFKPMSLMVNYLRSLRSDQLGKAHKL